MDHRARYRGLFSGGAASVALGVLLLSGVADVPAATPADNVAVGLGSYFTKPHGGLTGSEAVPPDAAWRGAEVRDRAAPSNQWYSSVIFQRWSQPLYAQPLTYRAVEQGFEIGLPAKRLVVEDKGNKREMRWLHAAAITVAPLAFSPKDARLSNYSDWLAEVSLAAAADQSLKATVLHGSPYSYFECSSGDVRLRLSTEPRILWDPREPARDARVAAFVVDGHAYAVFAPTGARYEWPEPRELVLHLPAGARYFSIAGLPDERDATVRDFLAFAYAFPTDTRAAWAYDERASTVRTTFTVTTVAREGTNTRTLMGLYPHQWSALPRPVNERYRYDSVRGAIRVVDGNEFVVERPYHGFVPYWGALEDAADRSQVDGLLVGDLAKSDQLFMKLGRGTYWIGKGLNAAVQLASIAEVEGKVSTRDAFLKKARERLEDWLDGKHATYFVHDARSGSFVGYPQEYNSVTDLNDHHFHYGYWITAAAHVALRDPLWLAPERWGGMVARIVADIATPERGRRDFPYLRNFDAYEGHSWASGIADMEAGNNQESSSEAVNAWAGLILLGEATGDRALRDLGVYLYTSEIASVQQYWFDLDHQVITPDFGEQFASMVFGGKYAYNTWWTEEPRQIAGINAVPFTPASTYLGADPEFVRRVIEPLPAKQKAYYANGVTDGTPADIWQDVIASYLALADADAGRALWNKQGSSEFGETRTHTLYWLLSLKEMGRPDFTVSADTPLYAVFRDRNGRRTYLAYNAHDTPLHVTYSNGKSLDVPAHGLAREH